MSAPAKPSNSDDATLREVEAEQGKGDASSERLARTVASLAVDDLPGMADAHAAFDALLEAAKERGLLDDPAHAALAGGIEQGRASLEKLILAEVDDAATEIERVRQVAESVVALFDGREPGTNTTEAEPSLSGVTEIGGIVTNDVEDAAEPVAAEPVPTEPEQAVEEVVLSEEDLPLVVEFVTEASGHLDQAEQDLLTLEENPSDSDAIGSLFRAFHTIKGVAGFLNLQQIQGLAHATENLLDQAREGKLALSGGATGIVLEALDLMKVLVRDLDAAAKADGKVLPVDDVPHLCRRLDAFVAGGGESTEIPEERSGNERRQAQVPFDGPEKRSGEDRREVSTKAATGDGTVKVATDRLDSLIDTVGELVIANSMVGRDIATIAASDARLGRNSAQLGKIVRELQDLSMGLRMVPVGNAFRKMARVVRDVSQKAGKKAELVIEGGDTELDRNVVDALGDPLVHMVRNSVDHGLESPEDREKAGKSPVGKVTLRASHKGGAINIEIADNGRGLNAEKILTKARANGVVGPDEQPADADIYRLIFHAGLSTAEKLTDISGRGVGMDVVKRNIESLRGRVDITSTPGQGSVFTIRLPLTLAVIDGLVIRVGPPEGAPATATGERYILPIGSVEQSLRPTPEMLSTVQDRGEMLHVRGELLPLVRLHSLFGVEPRSADPDKAIVVIVQDAERRCCLLVDDLLGQEQVVIKSLGSLGDRIGPIKGVSGGAVLGDGTVSLILDVPGLLDLSAG
ncbi:MAG: chemotaxis protein CheA [Planctomycetota bacterium]